MFIESKRLIITEFTMDMAAAVQQNSVDEDNRRFVPDEVWDTVEEAEVYGICLAENKASLAVMRKCGFEHVFSGKGNYQGAEQEIVKNVCRHE